MFFYNKNYFITNYKDYLNTKAFKVIGIINKKLGFILRDTLQ